MDKLEPSEFERIQKMRQDFVANVSHELRTPLTVIRGYIETLMLTHQNDLKLHGIFEKIAEQSERMQALVEKLMQLSRIESEDPHAAETPIDIDKLLSRIESDARNLSKHGHQLLFTTTPGLGLLGDEHEIYTAFSNLVFNAIHYTPAGGNIEIRWHSDQHNLYFSVKDTGIGIAAEHIPRLTERFYRVDKSRSRRSGGAGLGLAITKHILMRHAAKLKIESCLGHGSMFTCQFPIRRKCDLA